MTSYPTLNFALGETADLLYKASENLLKAKSLHTLMKLTGKMNFHRIYGQNWGTLDCSV